MKQKIRLGDSYALTKHKQLKTRYFSLLAVLTTMCLYARGLRPTRVWSGLPLGIVLSCFLAAGFSANAQFYAPSAVSKSVGDTLTNSFFETAHQAVYANTGQSTTIRLADYRDKLIILDFWATWCGPCIVSLNRLDSVQRQMDTQDFVVIPVTSQNASVAKTAVRRYRWDMASIVADTTLARIFPHSGLPHMIWIKGDKVIANPIHYFATSENIQKAIFGQRFKMRSQRRDFDFEMFVREGLRDQNTRFESRLVSGNPSYNQHQLKYERRNGMTFLFVGNVGVVNGLFAHAFKTDIPSYLSRSTISGNNGIHIETTDEITNLLTTPKPLRRAYQDVNEFQDTLDRWVNNHQYSYWLKVNKPVSESEARHIMRQDINAYFAAKWGIVGMIEKRPKKLIVLTTTGSANESRKLLESTGNQIFTIADSAGSYRIKNAHISMIRVALAKTGILPNRPLLDKTGLPDDLVIDFGLTYSKDLDLKGLNEQLNKYGLKIDLVESEEPVLVIKNN